MRILAALSLAALVVAGTSHLLRHSTATPWLARRYRTPSIARQGAFQTMAVKTIERRLGPAEAPRHKVWFGHDELVISYVNTFSRCGEHIASD